MSTPSSARRPRVVGYPLRFKRLFIETFGMVLMGVGIGLLVATGDLPYMLVIFLGLAIFQRPTTNYMPRTGSAVDFLFRLSTEWSDRRQRNRDKP